MEIQQLINQLTENAAVGLVLFDKETQLLFANNFLCQRTGFSQEELLGNGFFQYLFHEQGPKDQIQKKITSCYTRPFENLRTHLHKKQKGTIMANISGSPFIHQEKTYISCVIQDITHQEAYEKVIQAGYDNLQQLTIDLEAAMKKNREQQKMLEAYKEKMSRELDIATSVQNALIPREFPQNSSIDMWGISIPSEKLGGDYFDFFQLSETRIGVLIADVSGHGVGVSLLTTMLKAYFEYYTKRYSHPDRLFYSINNTMTQFLKGTGLYFTALYYVLDLTTLKITCCIAGHDPALLFHQEKEEPEKLGIGAEGMVLGLVPNTKYQSVTVQLEPGSKIIFYTDGITEARNEKGEFYGINGLISYIQTIKQSSARDCVEKLISNIDTYYGNKEANDDRTVIVVNVLKKLKSKAEQLEKARTLINEKKYTEVIDILNNIIEDNKQSPIAYRLLGKTYAVLGELKKAQQSLIRAIELNDSSHESYYNLGIVKYYLKEYKSAAGCFTKVRYLTGNYKKTEKYENMIAEMLQKKQ
jgi:PAS domain S-box-containing protein